MKTQSVTQYCGYTVEQVDQKWLVTKRGCNALPGATHANSREGAMRLLHCLIVTQPADHDGISSKSDPHWSDRFWSMVRLTENAA